jgi:uncharacterized protein (TIGR00299 family) protein
MKIAYLDCFAGVSGDMFVGALLDAGLSLADLERELRALGIEGYRLSHTHVDKCGLRASYFQVFLGEHGEEKEQPNELTSPHSHSHSHSHSHGHSFAEIRALIGGSALRDSVKERALRIFARLAEAEGHVHGTDPEQAQFHEVGMLDAIVDIVSAAIGIELLGIERVACSPLHVGSGFVKMAHGVYPIPAPATARLLQGAPTYSTEARGELVTPTGAAIVTALAQEFGPQPAMVVEHTGYGAGTKNRDFPNVLRMLIGSSVAPREPHPSQHAAPTTAGGWHEGAAVVIEANLDDMNPQWYDALFERLLAAGALDVLLLPAQMKKQRPGVLLQVLARPDAVDELAAIVFTESSTIGLRTYPVTRRMLQRETRTAATRFGPVRVKIARLGDRVVNVAPEYEDCRAAARAHGVAVKAVHAAAVAAADSAC